MLKAKLKKLLKRLGFIRDLFDGKLSISKAQLNATVIRANGDVEELGTIAERLVTDAFTEDICEALAGTLTDFDAYSWHDCGTDTTAESNSDTSLGTPYGGSRTDGTQVSGGTAGSRTYQSVGTINFSGSFAITEHGLFNASTGGILMDRSVFSAINVENGDSIQFTYTLTINAET